MLKVNAGHPFLAESKARRALSLAIDARASRKRRMLSSKGATQLFRLRSEIGATHAFAAGYDLEEAANSAAAWLGHGQRRDLHNGERAP